MSDNAIIEIENLYREFRTDSGSVVVLKNINLNINRGECIILKGVSGSGKTTLLSIIAGLDKPTSGKILVDGESIAKLPDLHISRFRAKKIGMVFQHFNLLDDMSARDNVMVPLIPTRSDMNEVYKIVDESMKLVNIYHKADTISSKLSGGEKQRVAIARALVANPDIILCDEPTANLDKENSLRFIEILEDLSRLGKSIVVATHDSLFNDLKFANRVVPMIDGQIIDEKMVR